MSEEVWKAIPDYFGIYVSSKGRIYSKNQDAFLGISYSSQYPTVKIDGINVLVHRLVALAYVPMPAKLVLGCHDVLDVNHKNGDKHDFSPDNLEWTTRAENILHAYKTGLRSDNRPVLAKDLKTGEIKEFYSISECGRFFKVPSSSIGWKLKPSGYGKVWWNRWLLIWKGDHWPKIEESTITTPNGCAKTVIAIPTDPNSKSLVFESLGTAAAYFEVSRAAIAKWIAGQKPRCLIGWKFSYGDELTDIDKSEIIKRANKFQRKRKLPWSTNASPILVEDLITGSSQQWESIVKFAESVECKPNTIQKSIWRRKGLFRQYRIEYLNKTKVHRDRDITMNAP